MDTTQPEKTVKSDKFLEGNKALLAEISHKSDLAARNRKLRKYGFEATDVYGEVVCGLMERIALGVTFQEIVDELLSKRTPVIPDTSAPEAHSIAIGKLCAAAAERIIYRAKMERPVGDATAVVGEEVPTEQRELSAEESDRGNDRQMKAVLSRKAVHRGIHRADVYGVADFSRRAMMDNSARFFAEVDNEVLVALFDREWYPTAEKQREAWIAAFQGDSVADVLFGLDPSTGEHLLDPNDSDDDEDLVRNTYPTHFPYVPERVAYTRTKRPVPSSSDDRARCIHCAHFHPDSPFMDRARTEHHLRQIEQKLQGVRKVYKPVQTVHWVWSGVGVDEMRDHGLIETEVAYEYKRYVPPNLGKNCPPGKLVGWRDLRVKNLLPESATNATLMALHRALDNFGRKVRDDQKRFWRDVQDAMVVRAQFRAMWEERSGVGQGTPTPLPVGTLSGRACGPIRSIMSDIAHAAEMGAKEARRFSLMPNMTDGAMWDSYTISLGEPIPGTEFTPALPGVNRWNETVGAIATEPILVSHNGNMWIDGVKGTFVFGLGEWLKWNESLSEGRKVVKALLANKTAILLSLTGAG